MQKLILLLLGCLFSTLLFSQEKKYAENVVQFSGIVVTGDSLRALPYTNVVIVNKGQGTTTDYYGYFSFAAELGDSIMFSNVGYKRDYFVIPDTLSGDKYSIVQVLNSDTVYLSETVIYPWPSPEEFKDAFLALNLPDDDISRAQKNLDPEVLYRQMQDMPMDGNANYRFRMQQIQQQLYYAGQAPPIQLLNPFAWAQFFKAWKEGKFKRQNN
ncbi:MAG: carboxypeptidase-like regulatory domain-containing protein [Luteibaculum sp.]